MAFCRSAARPGLEGERTGDPLLAPSIFRTEGGETLMSNDGWRTLGGLVTSYLVKSSSSYRTSRSAFRYASVPPVVMLECSRAGTNGWLSCGIGAHDRLVADTKDY